MSKTTIDQTLSQAQFPEWLLKSKIRPAKLRIDSIDRPLLTAKLDSHLPSVVSLVQAPAGYGKSTVLYSWMNSLINRGIDVSWVSIDNEDNDPFQLLHYIAFSLFEKNEILSANSINAHSYPGNHSIRNLLNIILRAIESHKSDIVLMFDDFEALENTVVNDVIMPLIERSPENLHIVIASRDSQKLKIANLELKGLAYRLDSEHLKFTLLELESLLSEFLPRATIKRIYTLTEGWPVAVQLIRSAINQNTDIERVLSKTTSSNSTITDYLSQQIFDNLEIETQEFLMDVSLIDRVSCELADFLRQKNDSERLFSQLRNLNALILPVDDVIQTYRLHPIFRDFLIKRLELHFSSRKIELSLRAAEWYAQKGDLLKATRYYINIGQQDRVVTLINSASGLGIWLKEGLARLRTIIKLLDDKTVANTPSLALIKCIIEIKDGEVHSAGKLYKHVLSILEKDTHKNLISNEQLQLDLAVVGTLVTVYQGERFSDTFINHLIKQLSALPSDQHLTRGHFCTCLCGLNVNTGDFLQAQQYAKQAIYAFDRSNAPYGKTYIHFHMGESLFAQGKTKEAGEEYKLGHIMAKKYFNDDNAVKFINKIFTSELNHELNQVNNLPTNIENLYKDFEENEAWFDIYAAGYTLSFKTMADRTSKEKTMQAIERAHHYIDNQKLDRVKTILNCIKINLLLNASDVSSAVKIFKESTIVIDDYKYEDGKHISWREREAVVQTVSRIRIGEGELDEALSGLNYHLDKSLKSGHIHPCSIYYILLALCHHKMSCQEKMLESLHQALSLSKSTGFVRPFFDSGNEVKEMLSIYIDSQADNNADDTYKLHAKLILQHLDQKNLVKEDSISFSNKELEIIRYLAQGLSNKVIARNIELSHNTVRYHLKNIFLKLEVNSRSQAVFEAKNKNII